MLFGNCAYLVVPDPGRMRVSPPMPSRVPFGSSREGVPTQLKKLPARWVFGDATTIVRREPVLAALKQQSTNVVVNMLGLEVADRRGLFASSTPPL